MNNICNSLQNLKNVLEKLTGPEGCPWDKEQTPLTLADYLIEESHELANAIRNGDSGEVRGELGDLLFLILFVALWYQNKKIFSLADALDEVTAKMIRRHPHVFGNTHFDTLDEQLKAWEKIKKSERPKQEGLFGSLPPSLPALIKAYRINSKAARAGFTWDDDEDVEKQVESEWLEFLDANQENNEQAMKHELGDILFSLVELGRRKGIKANDALDICCNRFLKRYARMEVLARNEGKDLTALDLDEQDRLWNLAKAEETSAT